MPAEDIIKDRPALADSRVLPRISGRHHRARCRRHGRPLRPGSHQRGDPACSRGHVQSTKALTRGASTSARTDPWNGQRIRFEVAQNPEQPPAGQFVNHLMMHHPDNAQALNRVPPWLSTHAEGQAEIVQWLSFACNETQHGPCTLRLIPKFGADLDKAMASPRAERTLQRLESHLQNHDWLAKERPTIADCAVCPYVLPTPEGGVDLAPWPAILAWMPRIKELPACCAPG